MRSFGEMDRMLRTEARRHGVSIYTDLKDDFGRLWRIECNFNRCSCGIKTIEWN